MGEYTARRELPRIIARGIGETLDCPVFTDASLVAPVSGTFTLYDDAGASLVSGPVVVTANVATYPITGPDTSSRPFSDRWREEWSLIFAGSVTRLFTFDVCLARRKLYPVVTDTDLLRRHSDLDLLRPRSMSSYQGFRDEAWVIVYNRLMGLGALPYKIVTPWSVREVHLLETLILICNDFKSMMDAGDRWDLLGQQYRKDADSAWNRLTFKTDDDETGDGARQDTAMPVVFLSSTPSRRFGR